MKRYIILMLGCLIAGVASAQQTLEQKVSRAIEKTPAQARVSVERDFIQYYLDGDIENVDRMLMQEPLLANATIQRENGQRIPMVYAAFLTDNTSMLKVFYKHGAECEQCLKESFTPNHSPEQELTLQYQVPIYIEKHWAELEPVYKRPVKELPQVPSMEFPQVSVEFLGKKYEPKTSEDVEPMIKAVKAAYENEVKTKYIAYGKDVPAALTIQHNQAITRLEKARPQLVKYEERVQQQQVINSKNRKMQDAANSQITQAVKMFNGQIDLVVRFFKHFPKEDVFNYRYYPNGGKLMDIDFQIPVLYDTKKWTAYDARPETFGTQVYYRVLGDIKNNNDAQEALAIFAGSPDTPYPAAAPEARILAVFQDPQNPKVLRVIFYKITEEVYDCDGGSAHYGPVHHIYFISIAEGQRGIQTLQHLNGGAWPKYKSLEDWGQGTKLVTSLKKQMENEGYTLLWKSK